MSALNIAYFISPHGFGHGARASAVMAAIFNRRPDVHFHLFTTVPEWFFNESLLSPFTYYPTRTDVGLVQSTPMSENLAATIESLSTLVPYHKTEIQRLANLLQITDCQAVVCDISPLGIISAKKAGIPAFLVENFTWDWIYTQYMEEFPRFREYIDFFQSAYRETDYHIQTVPICDQQDSAQLIAPPIGRNPRRDRYTTRKLLGIDSEDIMVLVTMGGIKEQFNNLADTDLKSSPYRIVVPGGSENIEQKGGLTLLPHHSNYYHPDLVFASDIVIGKAGYSTVAEIYHANTRFGFVSRQNFRESPVLSRFVEENIPSLEIPLDVFVDSAWLDIVPRLLKIPQKQIRMENGDNITAQFILSQL